MHCPGAGGSCLVSGFYYVGYYGPNVKPVIKAGSWALGLKEESQKVKAWTLAVVGASLPGVIVISLFYLVHSLAA